MFKKIFIPILGTIAIGSFYLHKQKLEINNNHLRNILQLLQNHNPLLSNYFMKGLIKFKMIKKSDLLEKYVLSYGFDYDGDYLESLMQLGFNSVEVGPVSLLPSGQQEKRRHCGSKIALANINIFCENNQNNSKQFNTNIGVCIEPNYQILKYTPYLIAENIIQSMKQFQSLNQIFNNQTVKYFVFKLNNPLIKDLNSKQYLTMINQLIVYSHQLIQQTEKSIKEQRKQSSTQVSKGNKTKIYLQIPSKKQNLQLFNTVKNLIQTTHLLTDGQQLQLIHNNNNKINPTFSLGRKRLTFQNLIEKIINQSL